MEQNSSFPPISSKRESGAGCLSSCTANEWSRVLLWDGGKCLFSTTVYSDVVFALIPQLAFLYWQFLKSPKWYSLWMELYKLWCFCTLMLARNAGCVNSASDREAAVVYCNADLSKSWRQYKYLGAKPQWIQMRFLHRVHTNTAWQNTCASLVLDFIEDVNKINIAKEPSNILALWSHWYQEMCTVSTRICPNSSGL